ncbi:GTP-binding protein Rhes-like [Culicoides brevitarsis]|uniref:GTP-binding protein Rhes-like n=1 Tax=Culicoides brevitarsis TaxID=469753 RepID=UPI00307B86AB
MNSSPVSSGIIFDDETPKNCHRLVILGSARVGKTSLVTRFLGGQFEDCYTPTIEDFHRKLYRIRGEVYQLDILDTSGNHPFPAMRRLSFLTGDLFVLVFSMELRETYEEAIRLREQILEVKASSSTGPRNKKHLPKVPMVIAGNKSDISTKSVTTHEVEAFCASQDSACIYVEVSAKTNCNIDELFYELFNVAGLPPEMAPNHHKRVTTTFGSPCILPSHVPSARNKKTLTIKRRLSDAMGVVEENVRRPSIRTDLLMMRAKTTATGDNDGNGSPANISRLTGNARSNQTACSLQ